VEAPRGRRDEFVEPYFKAGQTGSGGVILKAREPARIMIAIGNKLDNRWHLQIAQRWVQQYNLYVNDRRWGRMFVRLCPYLPFSARVYLNQHHWFAKPAGRRNRISAVFQCIPELKHPKLPLTVPRWMMCTRDRQMWPSTIVKVKHRI